jgi:hypothetical protein
MMSSGSSSSSPEAPASSVDVDDVLEKLFQDSQLQHQQDLSEGSASSPWWSSAPASDPGQAAAAGTAPADAISSAADAAVVSSNLWEPTWYNLSDQAIVAVKALHDLTGVEYGWAIVGVTVVLRLALFPLMVQSQQTTSRMAHVQPELTLLKDRFEAIGTPSRQEQLAFGNQMKALFAKYNVKPFRALTAPLVQLPCFMGMYVRCTARCAGGIWIVPLLPLCAVRAPHSLSLASALQVLRVA